MCDPAAGPDNARIIYHGGTGTPAGLGGSTGEYLMRGDRVRITIDRIGAIENAPGPGPA